MNRKSSVCSHINTAEKGAALVMVLMVSALLIIACIGMLTAAAVNTKNVSDAIAEDQAYYAAESGLQATINVLRRNTLPNPLFNPTPSNE
jgi:type II secretory pathway component PulK